MSDDNDQPNGEDQKLDTPVDLEKMRDDDELIEALRKQVHDGSEESLDPRSTDAALRAMFKHWVVDTRRGTGDVDVDAINRLPASPAPAKTSEVHVHVHPADYLPRTTSLSVAIVAATAGTVVLVLLILLASVLYTATVR